MKNFMLKISNFIKPRKKAVLIFCSIALSALISIAAMTPGTLDDEVLTWIKAKMDIIISQDIVETKTEEIVDSKTK